MSPFILLPVFLGLNIVIQGVLNKNIGANWGLSTAVMLNATIFFVISASFLLLATLVPNCLPEFLRPSEISARQFKIWFLVPGICGFMLVLGIPYSLQNNGPSKTFILLIVSQAIFSLLYEKFVLHGQIAFLKVVGATLAVLGSALVAV